MDNEDKEKNETDEKKPFFSKLLESHRTEETDKTTGGRNIGDDLSGPVYVTMKYPSDSEDVSPWEDYYTGTDPNLSSKGLSPADGENPIV